MNQEPKSPKSPRHQRHSFQRVKSNSFRSHSLTSRGSLIDVQATRIEVEARVQRNTVLLKTRVTSWHDIVGYRLEKVADSNAHLYLICLLALACIPVIIFSIGWMILEADEHDPAWSSFLIVIQVMTVGYTTDIIGFGSAIVFVVAMLSGLMILAVLISMMAERFQELEYGIASGQSNVIESGHTLILGWNEATVRVVCQLARLRQAYQQQNETFSRRIFRWQRVPPSTPLAAATIVLLTNRLSKEQMHIEILKAFSERGLPAWRTRLGTDIICRIGDPTDFQDLQRMRPHRAVAILLQMGDADHDEARRHEGIVTNGMTLRVLLALRVSLFSAQPPPRWDDLRVVVHLASPAKAIDIINLGEASDGRPILALQDLSVFLNGLMFNCTLQPGLAFTLMHVLSFQGPALRMRQVKSLPKGGNELVGKTFQELALVFEDAVPAGIIAGGEMWQPEPGEGCGMAPTGHRTVSVEDHLIFISTRPLPTLAGGDAEFVDTAIAGAELGEEKAPVNVLVCGWRPQWHQARRFAFTIRDIAEDLPSRSSITFLCSRSFEAEGRGRDFSEFMAEVCCVDEGIAAESSRGSLWTFEGHVELRHVHGDAANYQVLEEVVLSKRFHQVVLVAKNSDKTAEPAFTDARVMQIMLYLRHIQTLHSLEHMHVIGDNALESTSFMALVPVAKSEPDFVNVHAFHARMLAQFLAYPQMGAALSQLFTGQPGMPSIRIESVAGRIPLGKLSFGSVVKSIRRLMPEDVLLGLRLGDRSIVIAPPLSQVLDCTNADCWLVLMTRRLQSSKGNLKDECPPDEYAEAVSV